LWTGIGGQKGDQEIKGAKKRERRGDKRVGEETSAKKTESIQGRKLVGRKKRNVKEEKEIEGTAFWSAGRK